MWDIKELCIGIIFNGCFKLLYWVDLVVKEFDVIYFLIFGNVWIEGDVI